MNQSIAVAIDAVMPAAIALGLFDSVANIQQATNTVDALGQVDLTPAGFATITGCGAIPCQVANPSEAKVAAGVVSTAAMTEALNLFHVLLNGYFPQIPQPSGHLPDLIADIDGALYQVVGVESDSQRIMTRLACKQVGV